MSESVKVEPIPVSLSRNKQRLHISTGGGVAIQRQLDFIMNF